MVLDRVKNKSSRECEKELEKIARENHMSLPERKLCKRQVGDKTHLRLSLDRDKLALLKSRLKIDCEHELLERLIEEKLEATESKVDIMPRKPTQKRQSSQRPRSISPAKRALVFKKAQKKCENCGSRHHLQVDHKISVAKGGGSELQNLRVLCRPCNQRAAVEQLGFEWMDRYINKNLGVGNPP